MRTGRPALHRRFRARWNSPFAALAIILVLAVTSGPVRAASWQALAGPLDPPTGGLRDAVRDPVRNRMLVVGGFPASELWALPLDGSTEWQYVPCAGTPMPARGDASMLYDPLRDRLLIFGGTGASSDVAPSEVWALDLAGIPTWSLLLPADSAVPARTGHTAIYDPSGDRMIVFGGTSSATGPRNDVWSLALSGAPAWTELAPAGPAPVTRTWHTAIHDPAGQRMLVHGGLHWTATETIVFGDTWALSLAGAPAWTELEVPAVPAPSPRFAAAAVHDPTRALMIVQGGRLSVSGSTAADAWALRLGATPEWVPVIAAGDAPQSAEQGAIYDPGFDRLVYEGGLGAPAGRAPCGALSLAGALAWSQIVPPEPAPFPGRRYDAVPFFDAARGRLLVFGGVREGTGFSNEIWEYATGGSPGWSQVMTTGTPPGFNGTPLAHDTARDRLLFVSGDMRWYRSGTLNQVTALDLETLTWSALATVGPAPPGRTDHSAVYDPVRDRIVVYGGRHYTSPSDNSGYSDGDAWSLSLSTLTWSPILPAGALPPTRGRHQAYFDAPRDRMVVFGGNFYAQRLVIVPKWDAWALALGDSPEWTSLGPDAPDAGVALHDAETARLLLLARGDMSAWALPLAGGSWQALPVPGTRPGPREGQAMPWDASSRRVLLFGGLARGLGGGGYAYRGDLWSLALDVTTPVAVSVIEASAGAGSVRLAWSVPGLGGAPVTIERRAGVDPAWSALASVPAEAGDRVRYEDFDIAPGGRYAYRLAIFEDGLLTHRGEVEVEVPAGAAFELAGARPNPVTGSLAVEFALPDAAPATLELLDLAGRRLQALDVGALGPGRHQVPLAAAGALRPALYFVRLTHGERTLLTRACVIR